MICMSGYDCYTFTRHLVGTIGVFVASISFDTCQSIQDYPDFRHSATTATTATTTAPATTTATTAITITITTTTFGVIYHGG